MSGKPDLKDVAYTWTDPELMIQALTHKSYFFEKSRGSLGHNEKLEFIGDAVIDLVVSELLFSRFPSDEEGGLSKKRASLVNEEVLALLAKHIGLDQHLKLGKGERKTQGQKKPRLLASAYEALIGAIYVDGGFEQAKAALYKHFLPLLEKLDPDEDYIRDYKTRAQETIQKFHKTPPVYELISESGPSHSPTFVVALMIGSYKVSEGKGNSKKQAEQEAARKALEGGLDGLKL